MIFNRLLRGGIVVVVLVVGSASARVAFAQEAAAFLDVTLAKGGELRGQVLDAQGVACPNRQVSVQRQGRTVAEARCDDEGRFSTVGLRGGAYLVTCDDAAVPCRLWSAAAAPPSSRPALLINETAPIARGQNRMRTLVRTVAICSAVGAGIAIPIALTTQEEDRQHGS